MTGGPRTRSLVASFTLFAFALAVPLVTLTAVTASWYVDSKRARLTAVGELTGDHLRERVDRELAEMTAIARALATSSAIDADDFAAFEAQARAIVDARNVTVTLADLDGRQHVNTRAEPGQALPTVARPALTAELLRTRGPVVSGLLTSGLTGRRIIGVNAPVIRDGMMTRVVSVVVRIEHFDALIADERIGKPYSAAIVDGEGRIVALTQGAPVTDARVAQLARSHGERSAAAVERDKENGDTLAFEHRSKRSDWTIVTGVEKAALETPLWNSLTLLAAIGLVLGALGALIALPSARRAAASVRDLAAAARTIGQGGRVSLEPSPIREVNVVGQALGDASRLLAEQRAAIEAAQAGLEARVEERGRALEASRAHYRVLAENVGDVIVLRRHGDYALSYVSPSSERMFGYDPETIKGFGVADNIHPEDVPRVAAVDAALGSGRQSVTCLFRTRRRDGQWIWVESVSNRIPSAGPNEPDVISVLRDVTERQSHADELRVARDMAELAQAKAENANRTKSEFLAVMSHEIRTPLSTIKGFAELLADTVPLSAEQSRYVALVDDAASTMLTAVDDIIDFAKVEGGELRIEARPFALASAVEGVAAFLRPVAARKGVCIGATLAPDLPAHVLGDERRLRQILLNLLNAMLRTRRGGLVTVSVHRRHGGGGSASERIGIAVSASGGRAAAADPGGLGPTIAQRLIGLMGGRLETISGGAEPSSYRFTLPMPAAEAPACPQEAGAAARGRPARLLLVEDHPINREVARKLLERAGHTVDVASDGIEAVAAVQARGYDLVLMDVQMADMDGLTATRRIRALQHPARQVPILAMTASVLPDQVRAFHEAGMNGHVAKPVDRRSLCGAVEAQLASAVVLESGRGEEEPAVFDRTAFDRLGEALGPEAARGALRGFVALLDAGPADDGARRDNAAIAVAARRLGFLGLAAAHDGLAALADGEDASAALERARIGRDLARRVLAELSDEDRPAPGPRVALL